MNAATEQRARLIKMVHIGKRDLRLSEPNYRLLLVEASADADGIGGLDSCANMTVQQLQQVIDAMKREGFVPKPFKGAPNTLQQRPLMRKVGALLADNKLPWRYADNIAKQMFGIERVQFTNDEQLHKIVAALQAWANRNAKTKPARRTR